MINASDIRQVHLELTEKCNARCPMCLRTKPDGLSVQPYIGQLELSLADIEQFLPPEIKKNLTTVHLCGNYGDPIMAKECLDIVAYLASGRCAVSLSTNGGARSVQWWTQLGTILSQNNQARVDFHIDGLSDTNAFYRRQTKFEKIIENASAFIKAGGRANWEFIPFKHNEHQIEEARTFSKELGFTRFTVKNSNRMFNKKTQAIMFSTADGHDCVLEAPTMEYQPDLAQKRAHDTAGRSKTSAISCMAFGQKEIYISCEGILTPCCWTARFARNIYLGRKTTDGFSRLYYAHEGNRIFDLRQTDLETAFQQPFFNALADLWNEQKPAICYRKCGKKDQPSKVKLFNK